MIIINKRKDSPSVDRELIFSNGGPVSVFQNQSDKSTTFTDIGYFFGMEVDGNQQRQQSIQATQSAIAWIALSSPLYTDLELIRYST